METIGTTLKSLRVKSALPLRKVAAHLDIDQAVLSKIEHGHRMPTKDQLMKLADFFGADYNELLIVWLSDKVVYEIGDEKDALKALKVAEEKVLYNRAARPSSKAIYLKIEGYLRKDQRVKEAWIYGSYARGEQTSQSDIDLMVVFSEDKRISLFDFADIAYSLGEITGVKIDLVEKDSIKPFAWASAEKDLIKIYG